MREGKWRVRNASFRQLAPLRTMRHIRPYMLRHRVSRRLVLVLGSLYLPACGSSSSAPTPPALPPSFTLTTPDIPIGPGEEKYVCFSQTMTEDIAVDRFDFTTAPGIHHVFLSRTIAPEPEGLSDCNVIYKKTWLP